MSKNLLILFLILGICLSQSARAESIFGLIQKGKLKEASDSLSKISTASSRDGNRLFYLSLIESNGEQSAKLMEAAIKASVSPIYLEQIQYKLAQYYFASGETYKFDEKIKQYRLRWENGLYLGEILRLAALSAQLKKNYDLSIRTTDKFLLLFSRRDLNQQGTIDKARIMMASNKKVGANELLRKLSHQKKGAGVAQALYMLASQAIKKNRIDDAVFYYNLLREEYPLSIGQNAIIERMMDASAKDASDVSAEKITGTFYSIQVGVFSKKSNAKKQRKLFKSYGKKIEIRNKKISGVRYHVVYVGKFQNYSEALSFKTSLEATHEELFQIIAR